MQDNKKSTFEQSETLKTSQIKEPQIRSTNSQHLLQPLLNLYTTFTKEQARGKLLIILFLILPWNLGKHFEDVNSYISGMLIPFLVPVIYLQDMVVGVIAALGLFGACKRWWELCEMRTAVRIFFLFLVSCFLSLFFADRLIPSLSSFVRILLYFVFFLVSGDLFKRAFIHKVFLVSLVVNLFLLSFLGLQQFKDQSALFKNYLFFGEQPYNIYTSFIAKESYGGVAKIPPYGTFQHPNTLAGFLVVSLTLVIGYLSRGTPPTLKIYVGLVALTVLCLGVLFLTKSFTAWVALLLGFVLFLMFLMYRRSKFGLVMAVFAGIMLSGLFLPLLRTPALFFLPPDSTLSTLSVERRADLLLASYRMFLEQPFFGRGINSFTYSFESFYRRLEPVRFIHPVHNVYALLAAEAGVFSVVFFLSLIIYTIYQSISRGVSYYSIALIQVVFLSSFDHYYVTAHQTFLLFILTLLFALTYTGDIDCL